MRTLACGSCRDAHLKWIKDFADKHSDHVVTDFIAMLHVFGVDPSGVTQEQRSAIEHSIRITLIMKMMGAQNPEDCGLHTVFSVHDEP